MISKKDDRLVDLEYMIPKEFKESETVEDVAAVQTPEPSVSTDACHSCNRSSHDSVLMPVIERGERKLLCSKCFKDTIDSNSYYGSIGTDYSSISAEPSESSTESTTEQDSSSPMSMFD